MIATKGGFDFPRLPFCDHGLFPLGAVAYCRSRGVETFRRPSFDREPWRWWTDPLQPIRICLLSSALTSLGASLALHHANPAGVMKFWLHAAVTSGLFLGERLAYRVFEKRIVRAS